MWRAAEWISQNHQSSLSPYDNTFVHGCDVGRIFCRGKMCCVEVVGVAISPIESLAIILGHAERCMQVVVLDLKLPTARLAYR